MPFLLRSTDPDATASVGAAVAGILETGDTVVLSGPLGAGKTRLVQGLAAGLGVEGRVTSPTFVLVRRHRGRLPLVHVDAYRLDDPAALLTLDDDVLADDVVTCIEWGANVARALPDERLDVTLSIDGTDGDSPRSLLLEPLGPAWERRTERLHAALRTLVDMTGTLTAVDP